MSDLACQAVPRRIIEHREFNDSANFVATLSD
jgi:hypothetical protein